jgi:hypothetical protein
MGRESFRVYGSTILVDNTSGQRNIITSTAAPIITQGRDGDVWLQYTA